MQMKYFDHLEGLSVVASRERSASLRISQPRCLIRTWILSSSRSVLLEQELRMLNQWWIMRSSGNYSVIWNCTTRNLPRLTPILSSIDQKWKGMQKLHVSKLKYIILLVFLALLNSYFLASTLEFARIAISWQKFTTIKEHLSRCFSFLTIELFLLFWISVAIYICVKKLIAKNFLFFRKTERKINFSQFKVALGLCAEKKYGSKGDVQKLIDKICTGKGPGTSGTTVNIV